MDNFNDLWQSVLLYCKERITKTGFDLWLKPIEVLDFNSNIVFLNFENEFKKNTVVSQYAELLTEAFEAVCGFPVFVKYTCPEDSMSEKEKNQQCLEDFKNETFTFDNYIVGPSNKFAYAAAKAVAQDPGGQISKKNGTNYNPLFIYGNSGLGKTHLLNAISYEIKRNYPDMQVVYVKAEEFANEFISCLQKKTVDEFKEKYRNNIDVFLVDDIQFIAGKTQTEEEFFHTFNALVDNGKQVILTSDRPPKEIKSLTDRLCGRFSMGLLADIQIPEYETRCAIIKRKAELLNFEIDNDIISYIAQRIKSNIRQLEGIVNKLHAQYTLSNVRPSISSAQNVIKDVLNDVQPLPVTINRVIEEVSRTTGVSVENIRSNKRTAEISDARKMCFYILREVTDMKYAAIGKEFNKDHSTVMYNTEKFEEMLSKDPVLDSQVADIINNIRDNQ